MSGQVEVKDFCHQWPYPTPEINLCQWIQTISVERDILLCYSRILNEKSAGCVHKNSV